MKTTIEIPDKLFRQFKATAALRGLTLREFVTDALSAHLAKTAPEIESLGWRAVFGQASATDVETVDQIIEEEFETVDPSSWQ